MCVLGWMQDHLPVSTYSEVVVGVSFTSERREKVADWAFGIPRYNLFFRRLRGGDLDGRRSSSHDEMKNALVSSSMMIVAV